MRRYLLANGGQKGSCCPLAALQISYHPPNRTLSHAPPTHSGRPISPCSTSPTLSRSSRPTLRPSKHAATCGRPVRTNRGRSTPCGPAARTPGRRCVYGHGIHVLWKGGPTGRTNTQSASQRVYRTPFFCGQVIQPALVQWCPCMWEMCTRKDQAQDSLPPASTHPLYPTHTHITTPPTLHPHPPAPASPRLPTSVSSRASLPGTPTTSFTVMLHRYCTGSEAGSLV